MHCIFFLFFEFHGCFLWSMIIDQWWSNDSNSGHSTDTSYFVWQCITHLDRVWKLLKHTIFLVLNMMILRLLFIRNLSYIQWLKHRFSSSPMLLYHSGLRYLLRFLLYLETSFESKKVVFSLSLSGFICPGTIGVARHAFANPLHFILAWQNLLLWDYLASPWSLQVNISFLEITISNFFKFLLYFMQLHGSKV